MKSAKIVFIILLLLLVTSGAFLLSKARLPNLNMPAFSFAEIIKNFQKSVTFDLEHSTPQKDNPSSSVQATTIPTAIPTATSAPSATSQPKTQIPQPKACYRFTVPHLDGSSSTQCYSKTDQNTLATLYSQYQSAKQDYEYYSSVAQMYYKDNIEFFKASGDKAQSQANAAKDRLGEISLQMYAIESRGW